MMTHSMIIERLAKHRATLPSSSAIAGLDVEVGRDATGDDAVWVWVVLRDEDIERVWPLTTRDELRSRVREVVENAAQPDAVQVYIRFRSESEHKGLVGLDWTG